MVEGPIVAIELAPTGDVFGNTVDVRNLPNISEDAEWLWRKPMVESTS